MIDELWYGNVSPMDDTRNNTEEIQETKGLFDAKQGEKGTKTTAIIQLVRNLKIRVLPPQP